MNLFKQIADQHYRHLPVGWRVNRLKYFARVQNSNVDKKSNDNEDPVLLCNYTDVYYNGAITPDLPFMEATATREEVASFTLRGGQVIITKDSESWNDIAIPALVLSDMPGVLCGYHLSVLTPYEGELDGPFLAWLCRADALNDQFKLSANGVTRFGLGQYAMKNAIVAVPNLVTQKAIASFLDSRSAQIDDLIRQLSGETFSTKGQREEAMRNGSLCGLLLQYRAALINAAVTGQIEGLR